MAIRTATNGDLQAIEGILKALGLPFKDCTKHIDNFIVAEALGSIVGIGGLERYGDVALLRSIAVDEEQRSQGLGNSLYSEISRRAKSFGVKQLYLLTDTAERYFKARGFTVVERDVVPMAIQKTQQFSTLCPASATVMKIDL